MLSKPKHTVSVACPRCGHRQPEHPDAYSTVCKKCGEYYRVQEALRPAPKQAMADIAKRQVYCFDCGTLLEPSRTAASTMCKRCSCHVDLTDYRIAQTVSRSFRTHGRLVIEEKGYLMNTDSRVGDAVLFGRYIGKLVVQHTLEIHSSASIKGAFSAGELVIPARNDFRWPEPLKVGGADIAGELAGDILASGTVRVRTNGRFFGRVEAASLVVESGAIFVGEARVGLATIHK